MGHSRYDSLPKSRLWREVISAFSNMGNPDAALVAATARAAEAYIRAAKNDPYLTSACWLSIVLPLAAREDSLDSWLGAQGALPTGDPRRDVLVGIRAYFERLARKSPLKNIFSEIAQMSFLEAISTVFKDSNLALFGAEREEVRKALARFATPQGFEVLIASLFQRFLQRSLGNFLEKEIPNHIGPAHRFATYADVRSLGEALASHCRESTSILSRYSHDWYAKNVIHTRPSEGRTRGFCAYAVDKVLEDLEQEQTR